MKLSDKAVIYYGVVLSLFELIPVTVESSKGGTPKMMAMYFFVVSCGTLTDYDRLSSIYWEPGQFQIVIFSLYCYLLMSSEIYQNLNIILRDFFCCLLRFFLPYQQQDIFVKQY